MWFSCHTFSYLLSFTCFPLRSHVIPFVITCSPFLSHVIPFIITCLTLLVSIHRLLHNPVHTDSSLSFPSYWLFLFFLSHRHSLITSLYIVPCILASSSFWSCLVFALPCTHLLGIYFALLSLPSSTLWVVSLVPLQPSPSLPYPKAGVFFVSLLAWASQPGFAIVLPWYSRDSQHVQHWSLWLLSCKWADCAAYSLIPRRWTSLWIFSLLNARAEVIGLKETTWPSWYVMWGSDCLILAMRELVAFELAFSFWIELLSMQK